MRIMKDLGGWRIRDAAAHNALPCIGKQKISEILNPKQIILFVHNHVQKTQAKPPRAGQLAVCIANMRCCVIDFASKNDLVRQVGCGVVCPSDTARMHITMRLRLIPIARDLQMISESCQRPFSRSG